MSPVATLVVVLSLMAVITAVAWGAFVLFERWWKARRTQAGHCELCWIEQAAFIAEGLWHPPLALCDKCVEDLLGSSVKKEMLESGRLRPIVR